MIITLFKTALDAARKAKDEQKLALLSSLYSDSLRIGKDKGRTTTDEECVAVVKKFIKGNEETIAALQSAAIPPLDSAERIAKAMTEIGVLSTYLPSQYSDDELKGVINTIRQSGVDNLGDIMKSLKENHAGKYDAKKASEIIRGVN